MNTDNSINRIEKLLPKVNSYYKLLSDEDVNFKKSPDKWSKKEILGHLSDSAINNLSRFIKAQYAPQPFKIIEYDQDEWVRAAHYQDMSINEVLAFWESVNRTIVMVLKYFPSEMLKYECYLDGETFNIYTKKEIPEYTGTGGMRTIHWLIDDYVAHMEYHLKQIPGINIEL